MGEIAEMMLDGILDYQTGEFIDDELSRKGGPGFPRTRERGTNNPVKGVQKYLGKTKCIPKSEQFGIATDYLKAKGIDYNHNGGWQEVAEKIQKDFNSFRKFVEQSKS